MAPSWWPVRGASSDQVTLCEWNPAFKEELRKERFKIDGVVYTRYEKVYKTKKGRKKSSPIWTFGEPLLDPDGPPAAKKVDGKVVQPFDDEDAIEKQYAELYGKKESATVEIEDDLYV